MQTIKTTLWISLVSALSLAGSACQNVAGDARHSTRKAVERSVEDVRDEYADRADQKAVDLGSTRDQFTTEARQRLARLDDRITKLRARGDVVALSVSQRLRDDVEVLAARLDDAGDQAAATWSAYATDLDDSLDELEREINRAILVRDPAVL